MSHAPLALHSRHDLVTDDSTMICTCFNLPAAVSYEDYGDMKKLQLMKILRERNVDYSNAKDVEELK